MVIIIVSWCIDTLLQLLPLPVSFIRAIRMNSTKCYLTLQSATIHTRNHCMKRHWPLKLGYMTVTFDRVFTAWLN